jgi:uncharacterized protein DUF5946
MESCAECGAPSCTELFHALLALDHSRQPPWGPLHSVSVACYQLQHSSQLPADRGAAAWTLLRAYLDGGLDEVTQLVGQARRANSHRVRGPLVRPGTPPPRETPRTPFAVTIEDVAVNGTFPAQDFAARVRSWATATTNAWH